MTTWTITGNATEDGAPLYLLENGRWTRRLAEALAIATEAERDALIAAAKRDERTVCDPYAIEVRVGLRASLEPTSLRERIRAEGPTVTLVSAPSFARATASA
jgi:hypothetical protein